MIYYISFKTPIPVGGPSSSITAWSRDAHKDIRVEVKGDWITLLLENGHRRLVHVSNVNFISEDPRDTKPEKAKL